MIINYKYSGFSKNRWFLFFFVLFFIFCTSFVARIIYSYNNEFYCQLDKKTLNNEQVIFSFLKYGELYGRAVGGGKLVRIKLDNNHLKKIAAECCTVRKATLKNISDFRRRTGYSIYSVRQHAYLVDYNFMWENDGKLYNVSGEKWVNSCGMFFNHAVVTSY